MSASWTDVQALSYIASYGDLIRAFGANPAAGRAHNIASGQAEGRTITFDAARYAASYGDLAQAFGTNADAAARHYIVNGFSEGRTASFDGLRYIASYGDLIGAFRTDAAAATQHYLSTGFREGRTASFDALRYVASYGDLISAFGTNAASATQHYIINGYREGRTANFDAIRYLASNGDLISAFGTNTASATQHYIVNGYREGRPINFDGLRYIASYGDLISAYGTDAAGATRHYVADGYREGRTAGFDAVGYLLSFGDLGAAGIGVNGALNHWVNAGYREGRAGDAAFGREQTNFTLASGQTLTSAIDRVGDRDWYRVNFTAGQNIQIAFRPTGAGVTDLQSVQIYDSLGRLFTSGVGTLNTPSGTTLGLLAPTTGSYYVVVKAATNFTGGYELSAKPFSTTGTNSDDFILGTTGNDTIDGGTGIDIMYGLAGNDSYFVDNVFDIVAESANSGVDSVTASSNHVLGDNVENLTLTGSANLNGTGNALANTINGNSGNNTINAFAGDDLIFGNDGNDTIDGGDGADEIYGDAGDDVIIGGAGNDAIIGGLGRDIMTGGLGADSFYWISQGSIGGTNDTSGVTATTGDKITDFNKSEGDLLRFSLMDGNTLIEGIQDWTWRGNGSYQPYSNFDGGRGQVRYEFLNGQTLVFGDSNRDLVSDFVIVLDGLITLGQVTTNTWG